MNRAHARTELHELYIVCRPRPPTSMFSTRTINQVDENTIFGAPPSGFIAMLTEDQKFSILQTFKAFIMAAQQTTNVQEDAELSTGKETQDNKEDNSMNDEPKKKKAKIEVCPTLQRVQYCFAVTTQTFWTAIWITDGLPLETGKMCWSAAKRVAIWCIVHRSQNDGIRGHREKDER